MGCLLNSQPIWNDGLANHFAKEVDHVGLRKKLMAISAIGEDLMPAKKRERMFVRTAVSYLPAQARTVLYLKFWEEQSLHEIGQVLGLTLKLVHALVCLALAYLERELRPYVVNSKIVIGAYAKVS
jgi:DNA-directed RNA polymerase specialized sigma24 family protein